VMAQLNRMTDTTRDLANRTSGFTNRRGVDDWMEADYLAKTDASGPRLVQAIGPAAPLLPESEIGDLRSRWSSIQAEFVDEPRRSVQEANKLVATTMQRLADGFDTERASLERQWNSGDNVSTEDLRLALQRYRAIFDRLLNAA
jgi:hypothetical protein